MYTKFQLDAEVESILKDVPQDQQLDNNATWINLMLGHVFNMLYLCERFICGVYRNIFGPICVPLF